MDPVGTQNEREPQKSRMGMECFWAWPLLIKWWLLWDCCEEGAVFFFLSTVHLPWILLICSSFNRENGHPLLTNSNHDSHQAESHSSLGSMRALWGWNGPMGIKLFAKKKMRNLESLPHEWTFQYAKAGMWPNIQCRCVKVLQSGPENQL